MSDAVPRVLRTGDASVLLASPHLCGGNGRPTQPVGRTSRTSSSVIPTRSSAFAVWGGRSRSRSRSRRSAHRRSVGSFDALMLGGPPRPARTHGRRLGRGGAAQTTPPPAATSLDVRRAVRHRAPRADRATVNPLAVAWATAHTICAAQDPREILHRPRTPHGTPPGVPRGWVRATDKSVRRPTYCVFKRT